MKKKLKEKAFTLPEVIITLVVIGVVAAITVPMMSSNAHDKKWNVGRQKAKATIGEAFRLMTVNGEIITTNADGTPRTTEYMVTKVLPKYLKLDKTCAPAKYSDCGFPSTVKTPSSGSISVTPNNYKWTELTNAKVWKTSPTSANDWGNISKYNTDFTTKYETAYNTSYYFRTLDGFSIAFLYNPYCVNDTKERYTVFEIYLNNKYFVQQTLDIICLMGIYDMNGKKGPNQVGKDIGFIGTFYNGFETRAAAVLPHSAEKKYDSSGLTGSNPWQKLYNYCDKLSKDKDWIMPDIDELSLIQLNYRLVANTRYKDMWFASRSIFLSGYYKSVNFHSTHGNIAFPAQSDTGNGPYVRCVRRTQLK